MAMAQLADSRWGRAVAYGVLGEVLLIPIVVPVRMWVSEDAVTAAAVAGSFVMPLLMAIWLGRRLSSKFVAHGVVIGLSAVALYLALVAAARQWGPPEASGPQPFAYTIAHGLKLLGGGLGGWIAQRRSA
jgi:hypothetical protein